MSMPLENKQDSSIFRESTPDNTKRSESEGGYEFTRPGSIRRPRRTFTTGFTEISESEKDALQAFYDARRAGAQAFDWLHPTRGVYVRVRFTSDLEFIYVGHGGQHRYNVRKLTLKEV